MAKKFKTKIRVMSQKERWTNKCKCNSYIPKEYKLCDWCLLASMGLDGKITHDALDFLCSNDLLPKDDVIQVIRTLIGETIVKLQTTRRRY